MATVGLLHSGEMGAALGSALRGRGHEVLWASTGRSESTSRRADDAALIDVGSESVLAERSDVLLSVCPPHAAGEVASKVSDAVGLFVDANAIAPATARAIAGARDDSKFVDGGIIGLLHATEVRPVSTSREPMQPLLPSSSKVRLSTHASSPQTSVTPPRSR